MSTTEDTIFVAAARAEELGIKRAVIASSTGAVVTAAVGKFPHIVWVSHHANFKQSGVEFTEETKERLRGQGVRLLTASHALSGAERGISSRFQGCGPVEIIAHTLRMFSAGVKVGVEIATMAMDAGLVVPGEKIIAIGGSGSGADTAIVITPANAGRIFDTRIHEIICKPLS